MLGTLFGREERVMANPWGVWPGEGGGQTWAGAPVNTTSATQLLMVYGCVRFIADGISTLPLDTYRGAGGEAIGIANPPWLERPTADLDRVSWLTQVLSSLLLDGNAYLFKTYKDATIDQLLPIDPATVSVQRDRGRKTYVVNGAPFSTFEVLHIPGVMRPGAETGMSPVEAARQTIGLGLAALEQGSRHFGQGQTLSGVIEVPTDLTPDKAGEMARLWGRKHSGSAKAHLPGVLVNGAQWKPTGVTNEQAQFLETRGLTDAQIASEMFLIDPSEFGLQAGTGGSLTYANLEQRNARKVQVTYLPWLVRLERAFSDLLAKPRFVKFNVNGLLRGDTLTRYQAHQIGINAQFLTPNEARRFEDMMPLDGGDAVVPKTVVPAEAKTRQVRRDEHGRIIEIDR